MNWLSDFRFGPMAQVVFGVGKAKEAGSIARDLGGGAALVMTDAALARLGLTRPIEASLREAGVRVETIAVRAPESRRICAWSVARLVV